MAELLLWSQEVITLALLWPSINWQQSPDATELLQALEASWPYCQGPASCAQPGKRGEWWLRRQNWAITWPLMALRLRAGGDSGSYHLLIVYLTPSCQKTLSLSLPVLTIISYICMPSNSQNLFPLLWRIGAGWGLVVFLSYTRFSPINTFKLDGGLSTVELLCSDGRETSLLSEYTDQCCWL